MRSFAGNDRLDGRAGDDSLNGMSGHDAIRGNAGDDLISGAKGADALRGGTGDDRLDGGKGRNLLTGGEGDDTFVFVMPGKPNRITDFEKGDLIALGFPGLGPDGPLDPAAFHRGATANKAAQKILYDDDTGWLLYARKGPETDDPVAFARIGKHLDHLGAGRLHRDLTASAIACNRVPADQISGGSFLLGFEDLVAVRGKAGRHTDYNEAPPRRFMATVAGVRHPAKSDAEVSIALFRYRLGDETNRSVHVSRGCGQTRVLLNALEARFELAEFVGCQRPIPKYRRIPDLGMPELHYGHHIANAEQMARGLLRRYFRRGGRDSGGTEESDRGPRKMLQ